MLRKVLKYDLSTIWKIWVILSATVIGVSVIGGLGLRDLIISIGNQEIDEFILLSLGSIMITIFSICGYILFIELLVVFRYYQNFFTDEAYLTFTLPVKRSTLFHSKLINAYIWTAANIGVSVLCITIILLIAPAGSDGKGCLLYEIFKGLGKTLGYIIDYSNVWVYIYSFLCLLIMAVSNLFSSLLMYACITLGCTMVKKYKLLSAILVYYLTNSAMSFLIFIAEVMFDIVFGTSFNILYKYSSAQLYVIILFTLLAVLAFFVTLCVYVYKFTLKRLEGNLNLA